MVLRQNQLGGDNIFADGANVMVGRHRRLNLDGCIVEFVDMLDHYHRVETIWHRIAGVDPSNLVW